LSCEGLRFGASQPGEILSTGSLIGRSGGTEQMTANTATSIGDGQRRAVGGIASWRIAMTKDEGGGELEGEAGHVMK